MIDLTNQDLSTAIDLVIQEVNRGCWLADRRGAANGGIGVGLPAGIEIKARVTARPGEVVVESISATQHGAKQQQQNENGTSNRNGNSTTHQSGGNTNETTNTYGEV